MDIVVGLFFLFLVCVAVHCNAKVFDGVAP